MTKELAIPITLWLGGAAAAGLFWNANMGLLILIGAPVLVYLAFNSR